MPDRGGIEQDANQSILFPYREYYYLKNEPPKDPNKTAEWQAKCDNLKHKMVVICAKTVAARRATISFIAASVMMLY